jgi:nucleoside-diphosphate-sugar epimerase
MKASVDVNDSKSLLVIGAGELGKRVAQLWKARFGSRVVGETRTCKNHSELTELGVEPCLRDSSQLAPFPYVVFCASPRGNDNYVDEVKRALTLWRGDGNFVFTSSGSVYEPKDDGVITEWSCTVSVDTSDTRSEAVLIASERQVLEAKGNVVRLAGLYSIDRGPHAYWFRTRQVRGSPTDQVNLIHYDDAASLVFCVLCRQELRGNIFLGCDDHPITKDAICRFGNQLDKYRNEPFPVFMEQHVATKRKFYNNEYTRKTFPEWVPKYRTFEDFVQKVKENR